MNLIVSIYHPQFAFNLFALWVPRHSFIKHRSFNLSSPCCLGQRICRRGTERPCYKVSYIQDSRRRLTFEDARQACRSDGGELLSIETESEQRLIERFIQQLHAGDGDFWIGLRRSPQHSRAGTNSLGCPSQYYWLGGSKAKFRSFFPFFIYIQLFIQETTLLECAVRNFPLSLKIDI